MSCEKVGRFIHIFFKNNLTDCEWMSILGFCSFHKFFGSREVFVDKEKVAGATRMVVEIDGRWDPKTLYTRIKSAGLPIQGVKLYCAPYTRHTV